MQDAKESNRIIAEINTRVLPRFTPEIVPQYEKILELSVSRCQEMLQSIEHLSLDEDEEAEDVNCRCW